MGNIVLCLLSGFVLAAAVYAADTGDLVKVTIESATIGVLLDEVFLHDLFRVETHFLSQNDSFWINRTIKQLDLIDRHLSNVTNQTVYAQLTPPDNQWNITFTGPAKVTTKDHLLVARNYSVTTYIVGLVGSAEIGDPALGAVGTCIEEQHTLPLDPQLVFQRTGFACMNEEGVTVNSIDAEAVANYFDGTCDAEDPAPDPAACEQCHCTQAVNVSCKDAMQQAIGTTTFSIRYCRVPWNEAVAQAYEALNENKMEPSSTSVDLKPLKSALQHHWIVYRYFPEDTCERQQCLASSGWRKLLMFDASHINVGQASLDIGAFPEDGSSADVTLLHNQYYWDSCTKQPRAARYASFKWGTGSEREQGSCILSQNREINSREVPISTPYTTCKNQGLSAGWSDSYNGGIPCQWIDITDTPSDVVVALRSTVNPKGWFCEGQEKNNPNGTAIWQPTGELTTSPLYQTANRPIDKRACSVMSNAGSDNVEHAWVDPLGPGMGYLTSPCLEPGHTMGSQRDCEFQMTEWEPKNCSPGESITITCQGTETPHVVRICEASHALNAGTACRIGDPSTLANVVILRGEQADKTDVSFVCPMARDTVEVGGLYAVYSGAQLNGLDESMAVKCTAP